MRLIPAVNRTRHLGSTTSARYRKVMSATGPEYKAMANCVTIIIVRSKCLFQNLSSTQHSNITTIDNNLTLHCLDDNVTGGSFWGHSKSNSECRRAFLHCTQRRCDQVVDDFESRCRTDSWCPSERWRESWKRWGSILAQEQLRSIRFHFCSPVTRKQRSRNTHDETRLV